MQRPRDADSASAQPRSPEKVRVVLCEDHDLFREGVAEMLSLAGDLELVAEAATHEEAVAVVSEHRPDVVLLDLEMPDGMGPTSR